MLWEQPEIVLGFPVSCRMFSSLKGFIPLAAYDHVSNRILFDNWKEVDSVWGDDSFSKIVGLLDHELGHWTIEQIMKTKTSAGLKEESFCTELESYHSCTGDEAASISKWMVK